MKDLTLAETNNWLDCIVFLMKKGKTIDEVYIELMERYQQFHEIMQLGLVSFC